jgi:transcriptional regulator with XRE-family HTH domain
MDDDVIIPAQIRGGRALLGWSQEQLAAEANVALSTVRDTENGRRALIPLRWLLSAAHCGTAALCSLRGDQK